MGKRSVIELFCISKNRYCSKENCIVTRVSDLDPVPVGSGVLPALDPDPVFKFLWIRIRVSNFSGSGSRNKKKEHRKGSKNQLLKNLKTMKKATISY